MKADKTQNCWDYWNCPEEVRDACPAYATNSGRECWMVAGSFTTSKTKCPKAAKEYKFCWECPWFKKLNPDFEKNKK